MGNKYYNIKESSDPKIIGVKNGGSQAEFQKEGFTNKQLYDDIISFSEEVVKGPVRFPDFEMNLEHVKMVKHAKMTDFISFYPFIPFSHCLISPKVQKILSTFQISEHKLYNTVIDFNDTIIQDYKLLFFISFELDSVINVQRSIFFKGFDFPVKDFYSFETIEEYNDLKKENYLKAKTLCLNSNFNADLDMFDLRLSSELFISQDLKETFEIAGITGIDIVEAIEPELIFE